MGREIRRVKAGCEHPTEPGPQSPWQGGCDAAKRNGGMCFLPVYDEDFESAAAAWKKGFYAWEAGEREGYHAERGEDCEFWEWESTPPDRKYYRPKWEPEEMAHFAVYETVSEGTPVTPAFATKEELVDYLVEHGDFWDELRGGGVWLSEHAERFVESGFAMSMVVVRSEAGVKMKAPRDGQFPAKQ